MTLQKSDKKKPDWVDMKTIRISRKNYDKMEDIMNRRPNPRSWNFNKLVDELMEKAGFQ